MPGVQLALQICQGADFVQEFIYTDSNGDPVDITGYTGDAEFRDAQSPTATLEATGTVSIVGSPTAGTFKVVILHDDTYAMVATKGWYTVQVEGAGPETRINLVDGSYTLHATTIASP